VSFALDLGTTAPREVFARVPGLRGMALAADGTQVLTEPGRADTIRQAFTLHAWVRPVLTDDHGDSRRWVVGRVGNEHSAGHASLLVEVDGRLSALLNSDGGAEGVVRVASEPGLVHEERWQSVGLVCEGDRVALFLDGRQVAVQSLDRPFTPADGDFGIGQRPDGFRPVSFVGAIDEVTYFGRALSDLEMGVLGGAMGEAFPDTPIRHWTFEPGTTEAVEGEVELVLRVNGVEELSRVPLGTPESTGMACLAWDLDSGVVRVADPGPVNVRVEDRDRGALMPVFDPEHGWWRVGLPRRSMTVDQDPFTDEAFEVNLENPSDSPQTVRLLMARDTPFRGVVGMVPMVLDRDGNPTGVPAQISKNWHAKAESRTLYDGQWFHGPLFLTLPAGARTEFRYQIVYGDWNGLPPVSVAQLCLIGWGGNGLWLQVAIGSFGEHICYETSGIACVIQDLRPHLTWGMGGEGKEWGWTGNVGGGDFLRLTRPDGRVLIKSDSRVDLRRYGPWISQADVRTVYGDREIEAEFSLVTTSTEGIARHAHRLRARVLRETPVSDAAFYQLGSMQYAICHETEQVAWGDADGLRRRQPVRSSTRRPVGFDLEGPSPWVSFTGSVARLSGEPQPYPADRAVVIRHWRARLGGQDMPVPRARLRDYGQRQDPHLVFGLVPPDDCSALLPGDFVELDLELLVLPREPEHYYGPDARVAGLLAAHAGTWELAYREGLAGVHRVEGVSGGRVLRDLPLVVAQDEPGQAVELVVRSGGGDLPVTFAGLPSPGPWHLTAVTSPGAETRIPQPPQVDHVRADGTWELSYVLQAPAPAGTDITLRLAREP
jgi:hypothetical protein